MRWSPAYCTIPATGTQSSVEIEEQPHIIQFWSLDDVWQRRVRYIYYPSTVFFRRRPPKQHLILSRIYYLVFLWK